MTLFYIGPLPHIRLFLIQRGKPRYSRDLLPSSLGQTKPFFLFFPPALLLPFSVLLTPARKYNASSLCPDDSTARPLSLSPTSVDLPSYNTTPVLMVFFFLFGPPHACVHFNFKNSPPSLFVPIFFPVSSAFCIDCSHAPSTLLPSAAAHLFFPSFVLCWEDGYTRY